jgi:hypothetical protein
MLFMNSELSVQLSELEHRYAEALTAGKDVKTLSRIWEKIKLLRSGLDTSSSHSVISNTSTQSAHKI